MAAFDPASEGGLGASLLYKDLPRYHPFGGDSTFQIGPFAPLLTPLSAVYRITRGSDNGLVIRALAVTKVRFFWRTSQALL